MRIKFQNDPDTGRIFSQPPLISFKRDKNIGNFLVRSAFQTSNFSMRTMQNMSFYLQHLEIVVTKAIH